MIMTEFEIKRAYREAKNRKKQIRILADLNGCSAGRIKNIVADVVCPDRRNFDLGERHRLYESGLTDVQIAGALGLTAGTIWHWRQKNGLKANKKVRKEQC